MSVQSQVQAAEEALRQALINALAEGDDQYLTELFNEYQHVSDLNKKISNTIRFTNNSSSYYARSSEFNFNLNSDYLDRPGGDLDALDNIEFSTDGPYAAGPVPIPGGLGEDVISFGDYKESRDDS
jgi:type II secretory pathway pseudopilin PulG